MNALIKKEARLLLPNCVIGVAAALAVWLVPAHVSMASPVAAALSATPVALACGVMLAMALDSFGREISGGTFANLLSQPVPRRRIWRTKAAILASGMAVVWMAIWLSCTLHFPSAARDTPWRIIVCLVLAVYSGGLWSVLLIRQAALAFWVTMLVPVALAYTVRLVLPLTEPILVTTLVFYSVAGFWWGRRLFLQAEDTRWTGGEIALPTPRGLWGVKSGAATRRTWRPHMAIFLREIMLHQSQWVVAGALALMHLVALALRGGHRFASDPVAIWLLDHVWMLWVVMPVLLGCAAVAEERGLGALEGELCLPVSRRSQFEIKFLVMLGLSLFFGMGMPLLLEGKLILPSPIDDDGFGMFADARHAIGAFPGSLNLFLQVFSTLPVWLPWAASASLCAGLATLSFYASTLSRGTFQALGPAALALLTTALLISEGMFPERFTGCPLWRGPLIYLIAAPAMILTLAAASFWNYQRVAVNSKLLRDNLFALGLAFGLVVATTTALYHRAWEPLLPEAPHGTALASNQTHAEMSLGGGLAGRLSDGRVWTSTPSGRPQTLSWSLILSSVGGSPRPGWLIGQSQFLDGTNWNNVAKEGLYTAGVKNDGSLWVSRRKHWASREKAAWSLPDAPSETKMERYGGEHDWKSVVGLHQQGMGFLLLKSDGSLWSLEKRFEALPQGQALPAPLALGPFALQRMGRDSNWAEISPTESGPLCRKTDGSLWRPRSRYASRFDGIPFIQSLNIRTDAKIRGWAESSGPGLGLGIVGLGEDGALRFWRSPGPADLPPRATESRLGTGTNWVALAANNFALITIRSDGSLWEWSFDDGLLNPSPKRLGSHTDWIGVCAGWDGLFSLAADGSVWFWKIPSDRPLSPNESPFIPLLAPSPRPVWSGNIFTANK